MTQVLTSTGPWIKSLGITLTIIKRLVQVLLCVILIFAIAIGGIFIYILFPLTATPTGFYFNPDPNSPYHSDFNDLFQDRVTHNQFPHISMSTSGSHITLSPFEYDYGNGDGINILVMTDFHFMGIPLGVDSRTDRAIRRMIAEFYYINNAMPDLILILGDNTASPLNHRAVRRLIRTMDSLNIPWAPLFGNHDGRGKADANYQARAFEQSRNSIFRWGPNNIGVPGNYFINIQSPTGDTIHTLYMLSNRPSPWFIETYPPLTTGQIDWYEWAVRGMIQQENPSLDIDDILNAVVPGTIPLSSVFTHVPMPQFEDAFQFAIANPHLNLLYGGARGEPVHSSDTDMGLVELMFQLQSSHYMFAGHDHNSSFSVRYHRGLCQSWTYIPYATPSIRFSYVPALSGNVAMLGAYGNILGGMQITILPNGQITQRHIMLRGGYPPVLA
ncbi:MAG: metallophosphoesterase [Firmicutes bacterium]|nr:metallophosphoesterase [Bacillota bacterium]